MSVALTPTIPSEAELKAALASLRAANPTLGVPKVHALLLSTHPSWTVSEKRTRKFLQSEGLMVASPGGSHTNAKVYPSSRVMEALDVGKWTKKVEVRYFDKIKGKGLVATDKIVKGETVWKEDPFVIAPEWEIVELQTSTLACAFCTTLFVAGVPSIPCPSTSTSHSSQHCPAHFCNRLCLSRSARTHPLLCPAQNPASAPLIAFAESHKWMALHALTQCTARVLLAVQRGGAGEEEWGIMRGFAELGMEERVRDICVPSGADPDRAVWKKAYELYLQAFQEPLTPIEKKKLKRILAKPLSDETKQELFEYDAFLRGLGRMSLNLEAHGGLYILHSHLNHSCAPNISVRHLDQRNALARITLVARCDIEVGEELLVTYVDPELGVKERRDALSAWGFGVCQCSRCVEEGAGVSEEGVMEDLERELKAGLGVL